MDWRTLYHISVAVLSLSYGARVVLFLQSRPRDEHEWRGAAGAASLCFFFTTLAFWLAGLSPHPGPVIYPPLVFAASLCAVTSVIFTWTDLCGHKPHRGRGV